MLRHGRRQLRDARVVRAVDRLPRLGLDVPRDPLGRRDAAAVPDAVGALPARRGAPLCLVLPARAAAADARQWRDAAIVGTLLASFGNGGVGWAETRIDSGLAALIVAVIPLWIAVLDRLFLGGRLSGRGIVGIAVGLVGVAVLVNPRRSGKLAGAGVVLCGSFAWAAGSIYATRAERPDDPLVGVAMQMLCGGVVLAAMGAASGRGSTSAPSSAQVGALARVPRPRRLGRRVHRLRLAAAQRAAVARRDLRLRQSGRRGAARHAARERGGLGADARRRRRDRRRGGADRDREAAAVEAERGSSPERERAADWPPA